MSSESFLENLCSAARENRKPDIREMILASRLSNREVCDLFCRASIDKQRDIAKLFIPHPIMNKPVPLSPMGAECQAILHFIIELMETFLQHDDFPASIFMDFAICQDDEHLVTLLLSKDFDIHIKVNGPFTAIQRAVMLGRTKMVKILLAAKANVNSEYKGSTLLHAAVFRGDEETTELLLQHGATVDAERQRNGTTALYMAEEKGFLPIVEKLIDAGASFEAFGVVADAERQRHGTTALYTAVEKGFLPIVEKLIDAGANFKATFEANSLDPIKRSITYLQDILLVQSDLKPSQFKTGRFFRKDEKRWTLLHLAAEKGYKNIVQLLLSKGVEVNACDNFWKTPLYWAALNRHEEVVRLLWLHGAEIDPTDIDNYTPLLYFAAGGYLESARIVLKFGANYDAESVNSRTPFFWAEERDDQEMMDLLLRCGAKQTPDYVEPSSQYLMELLQFETHRETARLPEKDRELLNSVFMWSAPAVRLSLEQGANVNSVCNYYFNRSALLIAADRGDLITVDTLLEFGADIGFKDSSLHQRSALHIAAANGFHQVVHLLLVRGADTEIRDKDNVTPLLIAVVEGALGMRGPKHGKSCTGVPPDYQKVVRSLLKFGANFNAVDNGRRTPLGHAAFRLKHPELLKVILEYGNAKTHIIPETVVNQLFSKVAEAFQIRDGLGFSHWMEDYKDKETTEEVLMCHFIRMKAVGLYNDEADYVARIFDDPEKIAAFRLACGAEVLNIRNTMVGNTTISFYDILTKQTYDLAVILNDPSLKEAIIGDLNTFDYRRVFPVYGNMVYNQLEKAIKRGESLKNEL